MSATRPKQRQKANSAIRGANTIDDMVYNEQAGAKKSLPLGGKLKPLGSLSSLVNVGDSGKTIAVFNVSSSTTRFFKTGDATVTAPTGAVDGIPVPASSYFYASLADDIAIIGNSGDLYAYEVLDDSYWG